MRSAPGSVRRLFRLLRDAYGPQGWWPLPFKAGARGFDARGYHSGNFQEPHTARGRLEVILGAVLTQNTAWTNVEKALGSLREAGITTPDRLLACTPARLSRLIRSSGYHNQKARKLKALAPIISDKAVMTGACPPSRAELLGIWGIGEETADSILLYAFGLPSFVVDAYTRRLLERLGWLEGTESYAAVQEMFHAGMERDPVMYNEYHAVIVAHAKARCRVTPICPGCPVLICPRRSGDSSRPNALSRAPSRSRPPQKA